MDFRRRKGTVFRRDNEVTGTCQFATPAKTDTADQGNRDLRDHEKFADHAVHHFEHLGNLFTRVIADIDAGGERSLAGTLNNQNVGCDVLCACRQHGVELPQQRDVQNIQRWTVHCDVNHPFFVFNL